MKRKIDNISDVYNCPIRSVVDRFGDKWSILVILALGNAKKPMRFNEMMSSIGDVSQKMLTVTLRSLESDGLVLRFRHEDGSRKVEYSLTELGRTLLPHIEELNSWAEKNQDLILQTRKIFQGKVAE